MASSASMPFTVAFYDPAIRTEDGEDRTLDAILAFSDSDLEYHHDFIQYLFPLPERSPINPAAPVLNKATREAFLQRPELRKQVSRSVVRMLQFYGFDVSVADLPSADDGNEENSSKVAIFARPTQDANKWRRNSSLWLTRFSHNHLRITRIIRCLRVLGMEALARGFWRTLLSHDGKGAISARTKMFWERAAARGLHLAPEEEDDGAKGVGWLREAGRDDAEGEDGFDEESGRVAVLSRDEVGDV